MNLNYRLILASSSPRRQELLAKLDIDFEVRVKSIEETYPIDLLKTDVAEYLARKKSDAFHRLADDELLITSDTTVLYNHELLEKAASEKEAQEMLQKISGKSHSVITGVCLRSNSKTHSFSEKTLVHFDNLSAKDIDYYISSYKPFDKAGAYGIQEWIGMIGITKIEGDFYNVMGLPLHKLYKALQSF